MTTPQPLSLLWKQTDDDTIETDAGSNRKLRIGPGYAGKNYLVSVKHKYEHGTRRLNPNWDPYNYGQQPTLHQAKRWAELLEHSIAEHDLNPSRESAQTFACSRCPKVF